MNAFPSEAYGNAPPHTGMTLRDYFAAKAMAAMLHPECPLGPLNEVPSAAYKMADAMMEARNAAQ